MVGIIAVVIAGAVLGLGGRAGAGPPRLCSQVSSHGWSCTDGDGANPVPSGIPMPSRTPECRTPSPSTSVSATTSPTETSETDETEEPSSPCPTPG
jgi:hypothetical protein